MNFTQNPIGSDNVLDQQDNAISFDYAMNSPAALWQDRFGKQHKTVQQALKDVGFKPAGFDFVSAGTLGIGDRDKCVFYPTDGYWYSWNGKLPHVIPANSSPTPGGKKGWGVVTRDERVIAREALRRTYLEVGLNLVEGSFEQGGILVNSNDVLLHERTGKVFGGPAGAIPPGTNPMNPVFVDVSNNIGVCITTTVAIAEGYLPVDSLVIVTDRNLAKFVIKNTGIVNGLSTLDAGHGRTAELVVTGDVYLEWLGDTSKDNKVLFEHASHKYGTIKLFRWKEYLFTLTRVYPGTTVFAQDAIIKNAAKSGAVFLNGELNNETYATGYNGDGDITFHGGLYDAGGSDGADGFAGVFAFGHGRNIKLIDPIFKNGVGSHYVEINGCQNVYIVRPKVINHFFPTPSVPGFYEDFQIDNMGSSAQFGFFGSYDGTPCDNIQILDFDSDSSDVVVGTHTPTADGREHTNIKITGITRSPKFHAVQAMTWKDSEINIKVGDCHYDSVKVSGGCNNIDIKVEQITSSTDGYSIVKCEEIIARPNHGIIIDVRSKETIKSVNVVRLNKSQNIILKTKIAGCTGSLLLSNDGSITDMDLEVNDGGQGGHDIVSLTNTVAKSSRMLLEGTEHSRPLRVVNNGVPPGSKIKLNGVMWADGKNLDGQPVIPPGVELNGSTKLLSTDPGTNTGTATLVQNSQNFDYFLVVTGTASGGDLKTSIVKPYSYPDYTNKPFCIDSFSGHGTITFLNVTTVTWTLLNPLRAIIGVSMS